MNLPQLTYTQMYVHVHISKHLILAQLMSHYPQLLCISAA